MNKWVRRFLYFLAGLLGLLILIFLFLQTRWAKNIIRNKVESYVSHRTNTKFEIGSIDYSLPKWIELNGIFMQDLNKDTLMYGSKIKADVDMLALISGKYQVDKILMDNIYVNLKKSATDSVFNYQFIIDAFASKSESATQADTSTIDLSLDELVFKNVRFNMLDDFTGSYTRFRVKDFTVKMNNLDINTMNFDVDKLYADELSLQIRITKEDTAMLARPDSAVLALPVVLADSLLIKNSYVAYIDEVNKIKSVNTLGQLAITGLSNVDKHTQFNVQRLQLANSDVDFSHTIKPEKKTVVKEAVGRDSVVVNDNLGFVVNDIDLDNNEIKYDDNGAPVQINGLDYAHLDISKLQLQAKNTQYIDGNIRSTIEAFSFKDKSGFQLDTLRGFVSIDSGNINLKDVVIKTPNSSIYAQAMIYPASFTDPVRGRTNLPVNNIVLENTVISQKDLDLLASSLTSQYKKQMRALGNLRIDAHLEGNAREMYIRRMDLRSTNATAFNLQMTGSAANLNDTKNIAYNFNIANLTASRELVDPFVNDKEKVLSLPPVLAINGTLAGDMGRVNTNLNLISAYGRANAKGVLTNFQDPEHMRYDMVLTANDLETGKWIYQDSLMGKLTGTIAAKGSNGFDYKKMNLSTSANVSAFRLQKNVINNIKLNAVLANGIADIVGSVNDELLQMSINGKGNIKTDYPTLDAYLDFKKADLYALGYASDSMVVSALGTINISNSTPRNLDAIIRIDSAMLATGGRKIYIDSAEVVGFRRNDSTIITLASPIADADIATNLTYLTMPDLVMEVLGYYFDDIKGKPAPQGTVLISGQLKPGDTYKAFVNDFSFENVFFDASITNADRDSALKANVVGEAFQIGTNKISSVTAHINGTKDSLLMAMDADTIQAGNFKLYDAVVNAGFSDNNLSAGISSNDANKRRQFGIGVTAVQNSAINGYDIHLSDTLMLNYDKWSVNPNNNIRYAAEGFNIKDFDISYGGQKVAINSTGTALTSPLQLKIDDFKLSTVTAALNTDSLQLNGLLNADIAISDLKNAIPTMDGKLSLDSILYQQHKIGNLNLTANSSNNNVSLQGKLDGYGNNVDLSGNYNANNIDVKINLNPLTAATIEAFSQKMLKRSKGTVSGPINITGSVDKPVWNGELTFNDMQTTYAEYGTFLKMDGQKIVLQYPNIQFNNFTVYDSTGNALKIDGKLSQTEDNQFTSDLRINTRGFNAMHSTSADNKMVYGTAVVDLDTRLRGPLTAPEFTGNVTVKDGTDITYVQASTPASVRERESLIEFIDMDTVRNLVTQRTLQEMKDEEAKASAPAVLNYNFNLEVEPQAKFAIVLDPATGDELQVQGKANVNVGVLPNGAPSLVGTFNLTQGSYALSYGPISRKFVLQPGSQITLTGDPYNAIADITAAYEISTQPLDLISNEIGGGTSPQSALYKRKVPFEVLLKINGTASKPELGFDIQIEENAEGVSSQMSNTIENKLVQLRSDPSEMNKQVFALLAFGRFIGDESRNFFGNSGGNSSLLANESVSGFLNAAVDQIAADLIKGVDIDIDLKTTDSDPATQRTDLNVAFGKTFLDDRLTVSFGKSFTVDGGDATSNGGKNNNVQFLPDVNTTYKLSRDGRYLLRAYRRNAYEAILDGYFIETGVAFTLTMDYNKFKEIFSRPKKN